MCYAEGRARLVSSGLHAYERGKFQNWGEGGSLAKNPSPYSCCVYFVLFPTGCCLRADRQQRPLIPEENTGREREESEANILEQSGGGRTQIGVPV